MTVGAPHTSPLIEAFVKEWGAHLTAESRATLLPAECAPRTVGAERRRAYMTLDWYVRTYLPAWLNLLPPLRGFVEMLRSCKEITDDADWRAVAWGIDASNTHLWRLHWATAGGSAWALAYHPAWDAINATAGSAAYPAARAAVGDPAWVMHEMVGRAAIEAATRARARGILEEVFLRTSVEALQPSARDLLARMIAV